MFVAFKAVIGRCRYTYFYTRTIFPVENRSSLRTQTYRQIAKTVEIYAYRSSCIVTVSTILTLSKNTDFRLKQFFT